jgi:hypothetical protein
MSAGSMSPWRARLVLAVMGAFFLGGAVLVFWSAAPARVQCDFKPEGRIDVTVEHRMLGLFAKSSETIPDVVKAHADSILSNNKSNSKSSRRKYIVVVTTRDGYPKRLPGVESVGEGGPKSIAQQIDAYVRGSARAPLVLWSVPWIRNLLGLFLGLVGLFLFAALAEGLLRAAGVLRRASGTP